MSVFTYILCIFLNIYPLLSFNFNDIDLPYSHLPFYFNNFPVIAELCKEIPACPYKDIVELLNVTTDSPSRRCWGYETNCTFDQSFSTPSCPGDHKGWVRTKQDQQMTFYTQADFGYIREQLDEMKLLCEPTFIDDSSLECSDHLRFCRGRNIFVNFTNLINRKEPLRYKMDILEKGQIGGYCRLNEPHLKTMTDHMSPLQSWAPELRFFTSLDRRPIIEKDCQIIIEKPTFFMKIDATVNMYHHFCDFFNLYASMHLNSTHPSTFSTDINLLIWESYPYRSNFGETFKVFTKNPLMDLRTFQGKSVCFRNLVLPLLPRMIFGLYYNTPIIWGCEKSGLFKAFSEHILHRLKIPLHHRSDKKIRITFLSRETKFRNILNEKELIQGIKNKSDEYQVQRVVYSKAMSFSEQLEITRNTDIFIGIHGAGLTHLLFLPDWAACIEIYNCEDENCYHDLARVRGIKYLTWRDKNKVKRFSDDSSTHGDVPKFSNFSFDKDSFLELVLLASKHVKNHNLFKQHIRHLNKHDEL